MSIANPITRPSQMRRELHWEHYPMLHRKKHKSANTALRNKMDAIEKKLLSFGGDYADLPSTEEDYDAIMKRGQLFYGDHARMMPGAPSQCHSNSASLWEVNQGRCQIATGYALSKDGIWRQHSWVVQPLTLSWRVWETTLERVAYFGFVMTDEECADFLYWNS